MNSATTPEISSIEELTRMAMDAAKKGRWDAVEKLYARRARVGNFQTLPKDIVAKLIQNDQWIMTRIREVQLLTNQQLGEAQQYRRRLTGLKRQWPGQNIGQLRYRLSI